MQSIRLLFLLIFSCGWLATDALPLRPDLMSSTYDGTQQSGNRVEYINFGKLDQWVTRNIKESGIIGGKTKVIYAIGPTQTINGNVAYHGLGGSPWATSNVYAHVAGIHKANLSVWKQQRPGQGYCAKLYTHLEECKVLGIVNIKVLAAGSIFLGQMMEPISGVSNPMSKLNCGVRFNKKPSAIRFDYAVKLSGQPNRIKQTGFGGTKTIAGKDAADCIVYLQKRWEDAQGNVYAKRIGTMVTHFLHNTGWVNNADFTIHYGDITHQPFYQSYMGLTSGDGRRYAKNSKGKMVPIQEVGWGSATDVPTHLIVQFDSSSGGAFIGSVGNTLWVDNIRLVY